MEEELHAAGWMPGRNIDASAWITPFEAAGLPAHEAARTFLSEFGGLRFMFSGPGIECAREPFDLDPSECEGEEDLFLEWGEELGLSLFPIGQTREGVEFMAIDETGLICTLGTYAGSYGKVPQAFERLLLGLECEILGSQ
ncbi:SUKH-3 domain-containing protein [Streptomyces sp. NBC_01294]|uniref:SUKH-3 domain-containing protein n=1 Tax=Streptomyces sp. NBC_01294 TaxID=2903815 RepID=UPI002DDBA2E7|nr:SUKH-3 domain-containing protein [Streptomyces sp. NBC_01294]WRZ56289.1 SUKH-3 domain-containing protein [Streptomyces sp. NBC_01294]